MNSGWPLGKVRDDILKCCPLVTRNKWKEEGGRERGREGKGGERDGTVYESSCVSIAAPLLIQCFCSCSAAMGKRTYITKFVLCPVVDRAPCLNEVLYTGQECAWSVPLRAPVYCSGMPLMRGISPLSCGDRWMYGISTNSSLQYRRFEYRIALRIKLNK